MNNQIISSKLGHSLLACVLLTFACVAGMSMVLTIPAQASSVETVLYNFAGPPDGSLPGFKLIQDAAGNFYGVTFAGGVYGQNTFSGTVFELSLQNGVWVEKTLHSFGGGVDGLQPSGSLVMDKAGNLYGVTGNGSSFRGTVYELTPDGNGNWTETILHGFGGGVYPPVGGLTMDAAGNLYGVAQQGGGTSCRYGCGAVYELSPPAKNAKKKKWKYTLLYRFLGPKHNDGAHPNGDLVFDAAGNLYGTTQSGGANDKGTAFELSPGAGGWTEKVLYNLGANPADGVASSAGLIFDAAGNFYGTTVSGGNNACGTVFELSPNAGNWTENVLYSFTGLSDGCDPYASVTLRDGKLYGTTIFGGDQPGGSGNGVVFELVPSGGTWTENVLHTFTGPPDGRASLGVILDSQGNLYGTAYGGTLGYGVVYEISQ